MPLEDAQVVCAEEGRVYKHDITGKLFNKRFTRWFPNGVIPPCEIMVIPSQDEEGYPVN